MIIVFSGTGNSLHTANELSLLLGDDIVRIDKDYSMPAPTKGRVIWVFPVYSWGVPPVVVERIKNYTHAAEHYAVMTCGDDVGNAHLQWRKLIRSIGGKDLSTFSVQMPNTYVLMKGFDVDSDELEQAKLEASKNRISAIAKQIESHVEGVDDIIRGGFAWFKSSVIYPWFKRYAMSSKPFHAETNCTSCGLCARSCPLGNITMKDGQPTWDDNCALCLRCYHICPTRSVAYGKATKNKGQYRQLISKV